MAKVAPINWILIRGLSREKRHWAKFPDLLQKECPDSQIHVIDLPGVGAKHHEKSPHKIEDFVSNLRSEFLTLKEQKPGQKWGLICVSLGGMIGLSWSAKYKTDFDYLVTINSSGANLSLPWERLSPLAIKKILKLFFKNDLQEREKVILELTTNMTDINQELVTKWANYAEEFPLKREVFLKQVLAASTFTVPEQIQIPYLCLRGLKDKLTSPKCSKALADHFKASLESHPNAGHDLPLEDPQWILECLISWMDHLEK